MCKERVFGVKIEKIPPTFVENEVPVFLKLSAEYIESHIIEGIFRVPGERTVADTLKKKIEKRENFLTEPTGTTNFVHSIATVMMYFLRDLPEPLIPYENYHQFIDIAKQFEDNQFDKPGALQSAILKLKHATTFLPKRNFAILAFFMNFFYHISITKPEVHKMRSNNIAICIAPTLLHGKEESFESAISTIKFQSLICNFMIKYCPLLFSVC